MGLVGGELLQGVEADILVVDADPTTEVETAADRNRHRLRDEKKVWLSLTASGPYGTELEAIRIEVR